jgi:hypothetical protein
MSMNRAGPARYLREVRLWSTRRIDRRHRDTLADCLIGLGKIDEAAKLLGAPSAWFATSETNFGRTILCIRSIR